MSGITSGGIVPCQHEAVVLVTESPEIRGENTSWGFDCATTENPENLVNRLSCLARELPSSERSPSPYFFVDLELQTGDAVECFVLLHYVG